MQVFQIESVLLGKGKKEQVYICSGGLHFTRSLQFRDIRLCPCDNCDKGHQFNAIAEYLKSDQVRSVELLLSLQIQHELYKLSPLNVIKSCKKEKESR